MRDRPRNIFITGRPGVGKTTAIVRTLERLSCPARGFYTGEMRQDGRRVGFRITNLRGQSQVMAHVDFPKRVRVGKYGVEVESVDRIGVAALREAIREGVLAVIDEVGKMELASERFVAVLEEVLDADVPVLGTVHRKQEERARSLRERPDTEVREITKANRDEMPARLAEAVARMSRDA